MNNIEKNEAMDAIGIMDDFIEIQINALGGISDTEREIRKNLLRGFTVAKKALCDKLGIEAGCLNCMHYNSEFGICGKYDLDIEDVIDGGCHNFMGR